MLKVLSFALRFPDRSVTISKGLKLNKEEEKQSEERQTEIKRYLIRNVHQRLTGQRTKTLVKTEHKDKQTQN